MSPGEHSENPNVLDSHGARDKVDATPEGVLSPDAAGHTTPELPHPTVRKLTPVLPVVMKTREEEGSETEAANVTEPSSRMGAEPVPPG